MVYWWLVFLNNGFLWWSTKRTVEICGAAHLAKSIEDINVLVAARGSKVQLPLVD